MLFCEEVPEDRVFPPNGSLNRPILIIPNLQLSFVAGLANLSIMSCIDQRIAPVLYFIRCSFSGGPHNDRAQKIFCP
jgi:hypothetical protein